MGQRSNPRCPTKALTTLVFLIANVPLFARSYHVDGILISLDLITRTMLVSHRPIPNYMPAMVMPFRVAELRDLDGLHPGARIEFTLEVGKSQSFAKRVRRIPGDDVEILVPKARLRIGDPVPGLEEFRGKVVAVNFIYTRCPLPDVCPRLSASFATMQRRFLREGLVLLSISIDPDYDTPAVLAEYAKRWGANPSRWRFLTADPVPLAATLGEVYWAGEGTIGHNSVVAIIGRDGKLAARIEGANYRVDQLENLIAHELRKPS